MIKTICDKCGKEVGCSGIKVTFESVDKKPSHYDKEQHLCICCHIDYESFIKNEEDKTTKQLQEELKECDTSWRNLIERNHGLKQKIKDLEKEITRLQDVNINQGNELDKTRKEKAELEQQNTILINDYLGNTYIYKSIRNQDILNIIRCLTDMDYNNAMHLLNKII